MTEPNQFPPRVELKNADCLLAMRDIPTGSIDMILCDLPYGATKCSWDVVIPFVPLWEQYERIIKDHGAIVLFGSEPFTFFLGMSKIELFRHALAWTKTKASNFQHARRMPMKRHENILVFGKKSPRFFLDLKPMPIPVKQSRKNKGANLHGARIKDSGEYLQRETGFVFSDIHFPNPSGKGQLHPTQKPVPLLEFLIKTYTKPGDLVLDNCMGSGSTGVAAINTGRGFFGIEKDNKYFSISQERILSASRAPTNSHGEGDAGGNGNG